MKYWLDSSDYRQGRRTNIDLSLLSRAYYEGNPYDIFNSGIGLVRLNLLRPMEEVQKNSQTGKYEYIGPGHPYEYNIAKARIDQMVQAVLPSTAELSFPAIKEDDDDAKANEYIRKVLNPGSKYPKTKAGLLQWMRAILRDAAQPGDRLAMPRYMEGLGERKSYIQLSSYGYADWDIEENEDDDEIRFFRICSKRASGDGKNYWHVWDIWLDHIVRYTPQECYGAIPIELMYPGLVDWSKAQPFYFPGELQELKARPQDQLEATYMKQLGEFLPVPIRYIDRGIDSHRGESEIQIPDMAAIDKANRHLAIWAKAVEDTNFPSLIVWDAVTPNDPATGKPKHANFRAGSQHNMSSSGNQTGRAEYADNAPTEFAFDKYLEQIVTVALGPVPNQGLKPSDKKAISEMNGFAHIMLSRLMAERVAGIRQTAIENGLMEVFRRAHKIAKMKSLLPGWAGDSDEMAIRISYGKEPMTADESLKQMLTVESGLKIGLDPKRLVSSIPMPIGDETTAAEEISKQREQADLMNQAMAKAKAAALENPGKAPGAPAGQGAKNAAGVDNNARK